jgi:RNA polymerase sigma-70 factor (ECF subfamily)
MHDVTLTEIERLRAEVGDAAGAFEMDEDAFRAFYDRTARALWMYLARITGDPSMADDLLQESYYRLLRAGAACENDAHRRHYLFRIATNLVHDGRRRATVAPLVALPDDSGAPAADTQGADRVARRTDLGRAMARLRPREREMLWLAYGQGASHREIADALGVKAASIKLMLFRARRKLANLLRSAYGRNAGEGNLP